MLDIAFNAILLLYFVACIFVSRADRRLAGRFLLLTYAALVSGWFGEVAMSFAFPPPPENVPIPPGVSKGVAADTMPGISGPIVYSVNEMGLRGPQTNLADTELDILCVGGSTTECLYVTDEESWPWRLQDKLAASLGNNVFVGNAGKSGELSLHHSYLIRNYPLTSEFDWVVVLCGINDMGCLLRKNYTERKQDVPQEALTASFTRMPYYRRLSLTRFVQRWYQTQSNEHVVVQDSAGLWILHRRDLRKQRLLQNTITKIPEGCEDALKRYRLDLTDVITACRDRGVGVIMLTQPSLYEKTLPHELDALLWRSSPEGAYSTEVLAELMERYNQTMRDVCQEASVDIIDLARALPRDTTTFYDDCHFNTSGCERVASAVFNFLESRIQFTDE